MDLEEKLKTIYTAHSKHLFYAKMLISAYVLEKECLPLNPFNNWAYFMDDMVERKKIVRANNNLIIISDELWQFGPIADGCLAEIRLAKKHGKKINFFSAGKKIENIRELKINELEFEQEVLNYNNIEDLLKELNN